MIKYNKNSLLNIRNVIPTSKELKDEIFISDLSYLHAKFTKIDDIWYFWKYVDDYQLLNELIGSLLAKHIELDTAEYIPALDSNGKLIVISKNFREPGFKYFMSNKLFNGATITYNEYLSKINYNTDSLKKLDSSLRTQILSLCILDLYMGQYDRHSGNLMFKVDTIPSLAPIYDYSSSFDGNLKEYYQNPFVILNIDYDAIKRFLNEYPEMFSALQKLTNIDMCDILKELEEKYSLVLDNETFKTYENQESIKLLKRFK